MDALCQFETSGAVQTCKTCGRKFPAGKRVRARCQRINLTEAGQKRKGPCQFLGPQSGLRDCKSCRGNIRIKEFACTQPIHVATGRGTTTYADCQRCGDYQPLTPVEPAQSRHVLFRFQHGVGDHVQLSVVLQHLKRLHPHVVVDICTPHPDRAAGFVEAGLCRRVLTEALDSEYDISRPLHWHEPSTTYPDSPSTKAEKCLREVFGVTPQPELCGYRIAAAELPPLMAEPFVMIHYRGWTMRRVKDVDEGAIRAVVRTLAGHGRKAVILDLDGQSQLDEPNVVHVGRDHPLWGGAVDTAKVAGLAKQAALCVGIDSGPGKLFSASGTPTIIVWRGNHPVQYHGLDGNTTHLVPQQHERLLIGGGRHDFFEQHYRYVTRRSNLADDLTPIVLERLGISERPVMMKTRLIGPAKGGTMIFSHAGDYGDVIYSLMAVRHLCREADTKCVYYLCPANDTRVRMTAKHAENILPLLRAQSYIEHAAWCETPLGIRVDTGQRRFEQRGLNMADQYSHYLRLPYSQNQGGWLSANCNHVADVIFARSQRYRNPSFPWAAIYRRFGEQAGFIGTQEEHADFEKLVGKVPFLPTPTLLDVAQAIAGCRLFVGNQSAPRAIAEGLKVAVCVEQSPDCPNTHFARHDAWYDIPPPESLSV